MPGPNPPAPNRPRHLLVGGGLVVVLLGFALPQFIGASPNTPSREVPAATLAATPTPGPADSGVGLALVRVLVGFIIVCGLCVLVARWMGRGSQNPPSTMQVLAVLPLSSRCVVYLVAAGGRRLLLGTDTAGIKSLVELPGGPEPERVSSGVSAEAAVQPDAPTNPPPVVLGPVPASTARDEILAMLSRLRPGEPGGRGTPG